MADKPFKEENYPNLSSEEIDLMNNHYADQFDPDMTPEDISALITDTESELNGATPEEIALLVYLHKDGETDLWVFDVRDEGPHFWEGTLVKRGNRSYGVVKDEEVEDAFEAYAKNVIDEIVLPRIPEELRNYFDEEKYIQDLESENGYGIMASYDGDDNEVYVGDQLWHVFRVN